MGRFWDGELTDAGGAEKVVQGLALFLNEAGAGALAGVDAVEAKTAESHAEFAPGGQRPDGAPEV